VEELTPHGHDDDIALIHVRRAPADHVAVTYRDDSITMRMRRQGC
jgi:hypothetical protein